MSADPLLPGEGYASDGPSDVRCEDIAADLVEYLIFAVPDLDSLEDVVRALAELVESGVVRILDVVVVMRDGAGAVVEREVEEVGSARGRRW